MDWCEEGYDWYNGGDAEARARFIRNGAGLAPSGPSHGLYSVSAPGPTWRWAAAAGANLWRTSIDIKDNWDRMSNNGFSEDGLERFAAPGRWNHPDMLEGGNDGADNVVADATLVQAPLYRKGMSEEEYRTHMSLWCLLAMPLVVGADLSALKAPDLAILTQPEVVAVDQDALGIQGRAVARGGSREVWMKPLHDGSRAVGLFNRQLGTMAVTAYFRDILGWGIARRSAICGRVRTGSFRGEVHGECSRTRGGARAGEVAVSYQLSARKSIVGAAIVAALTLGLRLAQTPFLGVCGFPGAVQNLLLRDMADSTKQSLRQPCFFAGCGWKSRDPSPATAGSGAGSKEQVSATSRPQKKAGRPPVWFPSACWRCRPV